MKKNGKYCNGKKGINMKPLAVLLALTLLVGCAVGGTLAWLLDTSDTVTNTFTDSDIEIELTETKPEKYTAKMIPGWTIEKDPKVTVKAGSEDCWVFIKVEEIGGNITVDGKACTFDDFISYNIDPNNWNQLKDDSGNNVEGIYVYVVPHESSNADSDIKVLGYVEGTDFVPNKVLVKESVTKEMMKELTDANYPKLKFTAYASQYWKSNDVPFTAIEAWTNLGVS